MTKVFYLGNKAEMISQGYDFSDGPVEVPESDTKAIEKFKGNRFFHVIGADNVTAPAFWVCPIIRVLVKNDDLGKPIYRTYKENVKLHPAETKADARAWIKARGPRNAEGVTHWIMESNEGISPPPVDPETCTEDADDKSETVTVAVFQKKEDGSPYSRPMKTFRGSSEADLRDEAIAWMDDKNLSLNDHLIMAR